MMNAKQQLGATKFKKCYQIISPRIEDCSQRMLQLVHLVGHL
jgi:hypothetical protein